jgi:hypothetical protein
VFGLDALRDQLSGGATQRNIEQEGITADINQFREERDYPQAMATYMRNALGQGMLPISTTVRDYQDPSSLANIMGTAAGGLTIASLLKDLFGNP